MAGINKKTKKSGVNMALQCHDIRKWYELLQECREELERIYGDRVKRAIPLYVKLEDALDKAVPKRQKMSGGMSEMDRIRNSTDYADKDEPGFGEALNEPE